MTAKKKHPQWILAIDAAYVAVTMGLQQGFSTANLKEFIDGKVATRTAIKNGQPVDVEYLDDLASNLSLRERERLEFDPAFLQPLNYLTLKQKVIVPRVEREGGFCSIGRDVFYSTYYRKKGVGEDRLADKMSNGWGGHTDRDMTEWNENGSVNFLATALHNIITEIDQECIFRFVGTKQEYSVSDLVENGLTFKGFILDTSDDVGRHHLALCWELEVPESICVESREDEQKLGPWCNIGELVEQKTARPDLYENWSNIVIDAIASGVWDASEAGQVPIKLDDMFADWTAVKNVNIDALTATKEMNLMQEVSNPTPALNLEVPAPADDKLIPLTPAGLTGLPKTESAIDWTPETSETATQAAADAREPDAKLTEAAQWALANPPVDNAEQVLAAIDSQLAKPDMTPGSLSLAIKDIPRNQ